MPPLHRQSYRTWPRPACVALILLGLSLFSLSLGYAASPLAQGSRVALPVALPAQVGRTVVVPVTFDPAGLQVSSAAFSIDYDENCLAIASQDANGDGRLDAVTLHTSPAFVSWIFLDTKDRDGELDIALADLMPPMALLGAGTLVEITFDVICSPVSPATQRLAPLVFSTDPSPNYGDLVGRAVPAAPVQAGSVLISLKTATPTPQKTPTATVPATAVPTATRSATQTPTSTLTPRPSPTPIPSTPPTQTFTPSPSPTATAQPTLRSTPLPSATATPTPSATPATPIPEVKHLLYFTVIRG